jgi:hypothetical protein
MLAGVDLPAPRREHPRIIGGTEPRIGKKS